MARFKQPVNPARTLIFGYLIIILCGTALLMLPISATNIKPVEALFTATSAVCVTGLIVKDTPTEFTLFGKFIILLLIQIGGIGYMTLSTAFFFFLRRGISLRDRLLMKESISYLSYENLRRFAFTIIRVTIVIEGIGTILLFGYFARLGMPIGYAFGHAIFHSVSAFCNAGFSTFSNNLTGFTNSFFIPIVISLLLISGGIGFIVISDIYKTWITKKNLRLSVHSKIVLTTTLILIISGTAILLLLEWNNSLAPYPLAQKVLVAYFQAVTPRTAGFSTIHLGAFNPAALLLLIFLMFIGASPGGTGGGIKTTTFSLLLLEMKNLLRGRSEILIFKKKLLPGLTGRAFLVFTLSLSWLLTAGFLLLILEGKKGDLLRLVFELTSAFGTVGLSLGSKLQAHLSASYDFSTLGKLIVIATMLVGRVGTLTVGTALIRPKKLNYTYPEGTVLVG
ncbi:MAG: TrkH family potassium uptake protein [candidate division WOR-3 bacterium]